MTADAGAARCFYCAGQGYVQQIVRPTQWRCKGENTTPSRVKCLLCDGTGKAAADPARREEER